MRPLATYRLQLSAELPFARAVDLVPYLDRLGISHLHLSPVLSARPGSRRFTDVADHGRIDEVLGGEEGLHALADAAHAAGMGLVGEVVPHHVGTGPWSPLWDQLLREGRSSRAARCVDIDWETPLPGAREKVILPVLAGPYGDELAAGRLRLAQTSDGVRVTYGTVSFPLNAETTAAVERAGASRLEGRPDDPRSWGRMHSLLEQQHYRLVSARAGRRLVNYRRVGDADELAALRVEDETVFDVTHGLLLRLVGEGVLDGLRIDHVDGLADPVGYLARLRQRVGPDVWLVVDTPTDPAARGWPVAGTTGYDLLRTSLGMHVDPLGLRTLRRLAAQVEGLPDRRDRAQARAHQLDAVLGPDLRRLVRAAWDASQDEIGVRDVDYRTVLEAVGRTLVALPAHRTYVDPVTGAADPADVAVVEAAVAAAREVPSRRRIPDAVWRWLTALLTGQVRWSAAAAEAVTRFQQLSAPVAVLGTHGRLFLRHQALAAACEVGCDPDDVVLDVAAVHAAIAAMPAAGMRTTASADVVHGEDVRLRLAALSGLAAEWAAATDRILADGHAPDGALAMRLLQLVVGTWPIRDDGSAPLAEVLDHTDGLVALGTALARGQDRITSHLDPDAAAEADLAAWLRVVVDPAGEIAHALRPLALRAAEVGMATSLAQVLLRVTVPGVPDTYQGTERWDEGVPDPDDGLAFDMDDRAAVLEAWAADPPDPAELWAGRRDGLVKQWVLWQALQARRAFPGVFGPDGAYEPVAVTGRWAGQLLVFRRTGVEGGQADVEGAGVEGAQAVIVCPRLLGRVTDGGRFDPVGRIWADTEVALPPLPEGQVWHDVLAARAVEAVPSVAASELLASLPVALLVARRR